MAKRFTDTEKWEDAWFRNLLPEYQRFWIFLTDKCDNAGVWEVDFEVAEFFLHQKMNPEEYLKVFKERIRVFDGGRKWFIPRFITFQYGTLDENCRPHKSVLNLLSSYKIEGYLKGINTLKDKTRQDNTRQDKGFEKKPVEAPKYCHDCERYFTTPEKFEKHLTACREKKGAAA